LSGATQTVERDVVVDVAHQASTPQPTKHILIAGHAPTPAGRQAGTFV
jgi:hypothetical protein